MQTKKQTANRLTEHWETQRDPLVPQAASWEAPWREAKKWTWFTFVVLVGMAGVILPVLGAFHFERSWLAVLAMPGVFLLVYAGLFFYFGRKNMRVVWGETVKRERPVPPDAIDLPSADKRRRPPRITAGIPVAKVIHIFENWLREGKASREFSKTLGLGPKDWHRLKSACEKAGLVEVNGNMTVPVTREMRKALDVLKEYDGQDDTDD